jgi:hypothetical protein
MARSEISARWYEPFSFAQIEDPSFIAQIAACVGFVHLDAGT